MSKREGKSLIGVWVSEDLKTALEQRAKQNFRSLTGEMVSLLEKADDEQKSRDHSDSKRNG